MMGEMAVIRLKETVVLLLLLVVAGSYVYDAHGDSGVPAFVSAPVKVAVGLEKRAGFSVVRPYRAEMFDVRGSNGFRVTVFRFGRNVLLEAWSSGLSGRSVGTPVRDCRGARTE